MPPEEGKKNGKPEFAPSTGLQKIVANHEKAITKALDVKGAPPRIVESRCHVCQSPYRDHIERQLVRGHSYLAISNSLPEDDAVERRSISKHHKRHMSITDSAVRAILEEEASLEGQNFEEGVRGAITNRGVLEIAMRRGFEDIINDVTMVEPRDLIQIIKLKMEMDENSAAVQVEEYKRQVSIFMEAIQNVIPTDIQSQLSDEIVRLRKRQGDSYEYEAVLKPQIEAEVVDDDGLSNFG